MAKDSDDLNGVESFVRSKIEGDELTAWLPSRTSCRVEESGAEMSDERDESEKMMEQVEKLEGLEERLMAIMVKIERGIGGEGEGDE